MRIVRRNVKYFLSVMLILTATACTKTEVGGLFSQEIAVHPLNTRQAKAEPTIEPVIETMGIFANRSNEADNTPIIAAWANSDFRNSVTTQNPKGDPQSLYLNDQCFGFPSDANSNGIFVGVDPTNGKHVEKMWPGMGSLMFSAYSPYKTKHASIESVDYLSFKESAELAYMVINVVLNKTTPEQQKNIEVNTAGLDNLDLLWADPAQISATSIGRQEQPVNLVFWHAMSKLTFNISNPDTQFKISAKLINCVNHAAFFSGTVKGAPGWLPLFDSQKPYSLLADYLFYANREFTSSEKAFKTEFITIPMDLTGKYPIHQETTLPVTLVLDIYNKDGVGHQQRAIDLSTITPVWSPKKHYTYNVTLNARPIDFSVDIDITVDEETQDKIEI